MGSFLFVVRRTSDGLAIKRFSADVPVYFEYTWKKNRVGTMQIIFSTRRFPQYQDVFDVRSSGGGLDRILDIYFKPQAMFGTTGSGTMRHEQRMLVRYERDEHLNDGRPRKTILGRDSNHFLKRARLYPRNDIPPAVDTVADGIAAFPWLLPIEDTFTGASAVDTARQMYEMATWAKTTNPVGLAPVSIPLPAAGGFANHPISERYSVLLEALQVASAATWFAWCEGTGGGNGSTTSPPVGVPSPIDFEVVPTGNNTWNLQLFVGGRGTDRRVGYSSNPVILSPRRNNVIQPVTLVDRLDEITRVIVGGAGQGRLRDIITVKNTLAEAGGDWNTIEGYHDSRRISDFGLRVRLNRGDQTALPADQLRYRLSEDAPLILVPTLIVRVIFQNDLYTTAEIVSYTANPDPDADEIVLDFGASIGAITEDYGGGARELIVLSATSSNGIAEAVQEGQGYQKNRGERRDVTVIVRQNNNLQYGRNLDKGDLISVDFGEGLVDRQVTMIRQLSGASNYVVLQITLSALDGIEVDGDRAYDQIISLITENEQITEQGLRGV